jgi:hypothetical protein
MGSSGPDDFDESLELVSESELRELRAENQRLRETLERIAKTSQSVALIARTALREGEELK